MQRSSIWLTNPVYKQWKDWRQALRPRAHSLTTPQPRPSRCNFRVKTNLISPPKSTQNLIINHHPRVLRKSFTNMKLWLQICLTCLLIYRFLRPLCFNDRNRTVLIIYHLKMKYKSITEITRRNINRSSTVVVNLTALNPFFHNSVITIIYAV